jgi:hypothetical protein
MKEHLAKKRLLLSKTSGKLPIRTFEKKKKKKKKTRLCLICSTYSIGYFSCHILQQRIFPVSGFRHHIGRYDE